MLIENTKTGLLSFMLFGLVFHFYLKYINFFIKTLYSLSYYPISNLFYNDLVFQTVVPLLKLFLIWLLPHYLISISICIGYQLIKGKGFVFASSIKLVIIKSIYTLIIYTLILVSVPCLDVGLIFIISKMFFTLTSSESHIILLSYTIPIFLVFQMIIIFYLLMTWVLILIENKKLIGSLKYCYNITKKHNKFILNTIFLVFLVMLCIPSDSKISVYFIFSPTYIMMLYLIFKQTSCYFLYLQFHNKAALTDTQV